MYAVFLRTLGNRRRMEVLSSFSNAAQISMRMSFLPCPILWCMVSHELICRGQGPTKNLEMQTSRFRGYFQFSDKLSFKTGYGRGKGEAGALHSGSLLICTNLHRAYLFLDQQDYLLLTFKS